MTADRTRPRASFECARRCARLCCGLVIACASACSSAGVPSSSAATLLGGWGAEHVGLVLSDSGGIVSYDCAHGRLSAPVRPDNDGRFEAPGVHVRERGGPVREGEVLDVVAARYVGEVSGDQMRLRVIVGSDVIGPFVLVRGAAPQLFRCL